MTTKIEPYELESLISAELDTHPRELMVPDESVSNVADAPCGAGNRRLRNGCRAHDAENRGGPEDPGPQHPVAALVGTFLGVLMWLRPLLSRGPEHGIPRKRRAPVPDRPEKRRLVAFVGGAAPQVAVEFGRRVIPANVKPSFDGNRTGHRRIKEIMALIGQRRHHQEGEKARGSYSHRRPAGQSATSDSSPP